MSSFDAFIVHADQRKKTAHSSITFFLCVFVVSVRLFVQSLNFSFVHSSICLSVHPIFFLSFVILYLAFWAAAPEGTGGDASPVQ